jgi:hypothetical protein
MASIKKRILNILIAVDQLAYVIITLGNGNPDETLSAAAWRLEKQGKIQGKILRPVIDWIFWFDPMHCLNSYVSELLNAKRLLRNNKRSNYNYFS